MPKTLRVTLANVADWDNVVSASHNAAKSKRDRAAVLRYFADFESHIEQARQAILTGRLCDGTYHSFHINDPKPRIIHAAPFVDRVIHHAIINCIGSRLEKSWVDSSYACRRGFGSHRAIKQAAIYAVQHKVMIKLDIQAYFAHINHDILLGLLKRQLKSTDLFQLLQNLLASHGHNNVGIPIGALTSQYFANHYLDGFDRWLSLKNCVGSIIRYMDDVLIFCDSLADARVLVQQCQYWLNTERKLILKPAIIQYCHVGVMFCGFKINTKGITMGKRRKRSYLQKQQLLMWQVVNNAISPLQAQCQANTLKALCSPGQHVMWRQRTQNYQLEY